MGRAKKFDPEVAVDQAMRTFWIYGYAQTSPQDLADNLGIGKGSLYNTFGSKHELFLKSLERYVETSVLDFARVMAEPAPIRDRVRRLLTGLVDTDLADPNRCGCLVINTTVEFGNRDEEVEKLVSRSLSETEALLRTSFDKALAAGEIAAGQSSQALAALVQSAMVSIRVLAKSTDDRVQLDLIVETTVDAI